MTTPIYYPILLAMVLIISSCSKPVTFQPAPEERAVTNHSSPKPQRPPSVQPWIDQQAEMEYPLSSNTPQKKASIPNFSTIKGTANRKRHFFNWLQPIAQQANLHIAQQRKRLLQLQLRGRNRNRHDDHFLSQLAKEYGIANKNYSDRHFIQLLLLRVDEVPTELILAQAAIESAWGQSRFAREGNNLFGEWCYRKGCGLIPKQRNARASHEVRFFTSPTLSVRAYLHNINTGKTYNLLRQLRHKERQLHQSLSGYELALGLRSYSERGMEYVRLIRHLINNNHILQHKTQ